MDGGPPAQDGPNSELDFLKNISEKRAARDGSALKRRGPKPDSKPALTRRQELNRQAQRTHRERKENYIKSLEDEVLRLKENFTTIVRDKDRLIEENRQLRQMIQQQMGGASTNSQGGPSPGAGPSGGGGLGGSGGPGEDSTSNPSGYAGSASGSYSAQAPSPNTSGFTSPPHNQRGMNNASCLISPDGSSTGHSHNHSHRLHHGGQNQGPNHFVLPPQEELYLPQKSHLIAVDVRRNAAIDYEQAGIDFVLTLEKPCMDHIPWLVQNVAETGHGVCGHALMASCPPRPFFDIPESVPFGTSNIKASIVPGAGAGPEPATFAPGTAPAQKTWELNKSDLNTLLALSAKLDLDGEITPVMAWGMVLAHPRLGELTLQDFSKLTEELGTKVRCYGFGAVMEEFMVRDALANVLSTKPEAATGCGSFNGPCFVEVGTPAGSAVARAGSLGSNGLSFASPPLNGGLAILGHMHANPGNHGRPGTHMYSNDIVQPGYAVAM